MNILVVGSGPSGVHFALTALRKGHRVTMLDVGTARPPIAARAASFLGLKRELADPAAYFLGADYSGIALPPRSPAEAKEYYGLPPSKDYVFAAPSQYRFASDGFAPLVSFAAGGLAESWTAGCYPYDDTDFATFPFRYADMEPFYSEVALRIGIAGEADDLGYLKHDHLAPPMPLDPNGLSLLARYSTSHEALKSKHGVVFGRSRQAVLTAPRGEREACRACGRCLWGCPNGAFYTPTVTLKECKSHDTFTYRNGLFVSHLEASRDGTSTGAWAFPTHGGLPEKFAADAFVLAAGAINSSNIVLRTYYKAFGEIVRLEGLMDNRQVLAPFFNFGMLGRPYSPDVYQYHQLAFGLTQPPRHYVHGQITTLKTAAAHPVLQNLPLDMRTAAGVFRTLRSGLGIATINFSDTRRQGNYLTLIDDGEEWPIFARDIAPRKLRRARSGGQ